MARGSFVCNASIVGLCWVQEVVWARDSLLVMLEGGGVQKVVGG